MRKSLKQLVLYREWFDGKQLLSKPSIDDNKDVLLDGEVSQILRYLESIEFIQLEFVSPINEPYNNDQIPWIIFSDGIYVWDSIIIHWIKEYRIRLPKVFLEYLAQIGYQNKKSRKVTVSSMKETEKIFVEKTSHYFNQV